jgi:hypothetical protein
MESVTGKTAAPKSEPAEVDSSSFYGKFSHDKPSDNVRLIAADLFQQYGSEPFSTEEMKTIAASVGITVPARVDATVIQAAEKGKKLFIRAGRGKFKPTVHGEAYLKTTYGVRKGTRVRTETDN